MGAGCPTLPPDFGGGWGSLPKTMNRAHAVEIPTLSHENHARQGWGTLEIREGKTTGLLFPLAQNRMRLLEMAQPRRTPRFAQTSIFH